MSTDREDRWGNDDQGNDYDSGAVGSDVRERAKQKVRLPAIGLIVVGVIALGLAAYLGVTIANGSFEKDMNEALETELKKVDDNPGMTDQQKQETKDMQKSIFDFIKKTAMVFAVPIVISGLLIIAGGVKLLNLSGRGFPMFSAILAMIPCCVSYSCVLGLPIGIWVMVVLTNPDVKAVIGSGSRPR